MTWLHRWIVDLFNAIAARYYRRKYGVAARQLGRDQAQEAPGQRGFIAVEIDGLDVRRIALASLGRAIGVVTQETYLFHASIRDNLLFGQAAWLGATRALEAVLDGEV